MEEQVVFERFVKRKGGVLEYVEIDRIKIVCCREHVFWLTYREVTQKKWCRRCYVSEGEQRIETYLDKLNVEYYREHTFPSTLRYIKPLRLDFYLPEFNLVIEFDGISHYKKRTHGILPSIATSRFREVLTKDRIKDVWCQNNRKNMLRIPFWDYDNIETMISNVIERCLMLKNTETNTQVIVDDMREWRVTCLNNIINKEELPLLPLVATDRLV